MALYAGITIVPAAFVPKIAGLLRVVPDAVESTQWELLDRAEADGYQLLITTRR